MTMSDEIDDDPWMLAKFILEKKIKSNELLYGSRKFIPRSKSSIEYHPPPPKLFKKPREEG